MIRHKQSESIFPAKRCFVLQSTLKSKLGFLGSVVAEIPVFSVLTSHSIARLSGDGGNDGLYNRSRRRGSSNHAPPRDHRGKGSAYEWGHLGHLVEPG